MDFSLIEQIANTLINLFFLGGHLIAKTISFLFSGDLGKMANAASVLTTFLASLAFPIWIYNLYRNRKTLRVVSFDLTQGIEPISNSYWRVVVIKNISQESVVITSIFRKGQSEYVIGKSYSKVTSYKKHRQLSGDLLKEEEPINLRPDGEYSIRIPISKAQLEVDSGKTAEQLTRYFLIETNKGDFYLKYRQLSKAEKKRVMSGSKYKELYSTSSYFHYTLRLIKEVALNLFRNDR